MIISDKIGMIISLTKVTKVPFLLFSNPGYGKTTAIQNWADANGYHMETLIGSQFTPEEIMGYQVNEVGSETLVHKKPVWLQRVYEMEAKGIPTVLFEDEISTCSCEVQGALLNLNFSRMVGNDYKLPESTVIIAAANYSNNLPSTMGIIAPQLNRFCVVNLIEENENLHDFIHQFLSPINQEIVKRDVMELSPEKVSEIEEEYNKCLSQILVNYMKNDPDKAIGQIDIRNTDMEGMYEDCSYLRGFLSGRTLSYLRKCTVGLVQLGIVNQEFIRMLCNGLVGAGTGNFTDTQQAKWLKTVSGMVQKLVNFHLKVSNENSQTSLRNLKENLKSSMPLHEKVTEFLKCKDFLNVGISKCEEYKDLVSQYENKYKDIQAFIKDIYGEGPEKKAEYVSDMMALNELFSYAKTVQETTNAEEDQEVYTNLLMIHFCHLQFVSEATGINFLEDKAYKDSTYGNKSPKVYDYICYGLLKGESSYSAFTVRMRNGLKLYTEKDPEEGKTPKVYEVSDFQSFLKLFQD